MGEVEYAALLCALLNGGEAEARQVFDVVSERATRAVRVDCLTPTHAIEIGLDDKASARDSVHQAVFAAKQTGLAPMVILIDRDGRVGRHEVEVQAVTETLGLPCARCRAGFLDAWSATAGSGRDRTAGGNDLPIDPVLAGRCPIDALLSPDKF